MGINLRTFQSQAKQQDGVFQLGREQSSNTLSIKAKPGKLGKRLALWVNNKESPEQRESQLRASQSFITAMREYFGDEPAHIGLSRRKVTADLPLTSESARYSIEAARQHQSKKLDALFAKANNDMFSGLPFLSELAADDSLKNPFTAELLRKYDFPRNSVAHGVKQALINGIHLSQNEAMSLLQALNAGVRNGGAALLESLQRTGCLENETIREFIACLPPKAAGEAADVQGVLHALNAGLLTDLTDPEAIKIETQNSAPCLIYQSPSPDIATCKADMLAELERSCLQHPEKSLTASQLTPFIQDDTLNSYGLLSNDTFASTQFGKDLRRDTGKNEGATYRLNGKDYVGDPDGALQALWAISGKTAERFQLLCNLMTQNSLIRPVDIAIGSNAGLADGSNFTLNTASTQRGYELKQTDNGALHLTIFDRSSNLAHSKFYLAQKAGLPGTVLRSSAEDTVRSTRAIALGIAPDNTLDVYSANHDITLATPLASLATIDI